MTPAGVPGVVESLEANGETTLVVDPARIVEACTHLRDAEGFNVLADLCGVDYLGWGTKEVAGYIGTPAGRDLNAAGSQGFQRTPAPQPKRFAVVYHLLRVSDEPARLRVKAWLDEGEEIDSPKAYLSTVTTRSRARPSTSSGSRSAATRISSGS